MSKHCSLKTASSLSVTKVYGMSSWTFIQNNTFKGELGVRKMNETWNPIIAVDFDGVIHSYISGWKGAHVILDPPVPGAIEWLMTFLPKPKVGKKEPKAYHGPVVQIYSSRSKSWAGRQAMKKWLIDNGLPKEYISQEILKFPSMKPSAWLTIDDRAICFKGTFPTKEEMMDFVPWNKK